MSEKKLRIYEVSLWTLQDDFITVLKPTNADHKGQISEPSSNLNTDGTQELSFSIPMYLYEGAERIENPIWYNTLNGNLIINLRKIKVIFNKHTPYERVFEFLITKVTERHEQDQLFCDIECEGLAFHELGKIGYKISLTTEGFELDTTNWFEKYGGHEGEPGIPAMPRATIQYWLDKFMTSYDSVTNDLLKNSHKWYYKIQMDWSAFAEDRDGDGNPIRRDADKIYEEPYTAAWTVDETGVTPKRVESYKEKERLVDLEESNIYNITQDLAEKFGVFCRYEYEYDNNYHIIGRYVVFYNNFVQEEQGYISLTYPYSAEEITREIDSTDVISKMYVRTVDDENLASGQVSITETDANKTLEDYILNFDYMYKIGAIHQDQYEAITEYENNVRNCNLHILEIENELITLRNRVPEVSANVTFSTNSLQLDKDRMNENNALLNALDNTDGTADGYIEITMNNSKTAVLKEDPHGGTNRYMIKLADGGVAVDSLHIYKKINFGGTKPEGSTTPADRLTDELTGWRAEYDESGNIEQISHILVPEDDIRLSKVVYLTYKYSPRLYYENIIRTWENRYAKDTANLQQAQEELTQLQNDIREKEEEEADWLEEKTNYQKDFELLMGPALREGYWQPEDFNDYGDQYQDPFLSAPTTKNESITGHSGKTHLIWDSKVFDGEQKATYEIGTDQQIEKYLCIDLSNCMFSTTENGEGIQDYLDNLSFMFYDYTPPEDTPYNQNLVRSFSVGSLSQLGYIINESNQIVPVLILTGASSCSQDEIDMMKQNGFLGTLSVDVVDGKMTTEIKTLVEKENITWVEPQDIAYLRIEVDSLNLKIGDNEFALKYNNQLLANYTDYSILSRNGKYYITIDSSVLMKYQKKDFFSILIKFSISNANTSVYLDAIQILKENSMPKVSYTVKPSMLKHDFTYTAYNSLARILNLNDLDLKFENVQGYISELKLNLDKPWEDEITVKNYKTKFEDLFSSIVAQTESMQKNEYTVAMAANLLSPDGKISSDVLQESLRRVDFDYAFNNGNLSISEENGIWGTSDSGVVAYRGGGIFTATEKDENGNWIWRTGIIPQGINADLITTGQLDTSKIRVYAGDKLRFQLNGDGLFAYKSILNDTNLMTVMETYSEQPEGTAERALYENFTEDCRDGLDQKQYVVHNEDGLFLVADAGSYYLSGDNKVEQTQENVERVAISWNGLTLRNWKNEQVFYADANTGDLTMTGTVKATGLFIQKDDEFEEFTGSVEKVEGTKLSVDTTTGEIEIIAGNQLKLFGGTVEIGANSGLNFYLYGEDGTPKIVAEIDEESDQDIIFKLPHKILPDVIKSITYYKIIEGSEPQATILESSDYTYENNIIKLTNINPSINDYLILETSAGISINKDSGIVLNSGSIALNADTSFKIAAGGLMQIEATVEQNITNQNYIRFSYNDEHGANVTTSDLTPTGLMTQNGDFKQSLYYKDSEVLNKAWLNTRVYIDNKSIATETSKNKFIDAVLESGIQKNEPFIYLQRPTDTGGVLNQSIESNGSLQSGGLLQYSYEDAKNNTKYYDIDLPSDQLEDIINSRQQYHFYFTVYGEQGANKNPLYLTPVYVKLIPIQDNGTLREDWAINISTDAGVENFKTMTIHIDSYTVAAGEGLLRTDSTGHPIKKIRAIPWSSSVPHNSYGANASVGGVHAILRDECGFTCKYSNNTASTSNESESCSVYLFPFGVEKTNSNNTGS